MNEDVLEQGKKLNEDIESGNKDMSDLNSDETLAVLQYLQSEVLKTKEPLELIEPFKGKQKNNKTNVG